MTDSAPPSQRQQRSESRQVGEGHSAGMNVEAAKFGAPMELRKNLAGIEQSIRVEGAFDPLLMRQVALVEHRSH